MLTLPGRLFGYGPFVFLSREGGSTFGTAFEDFVGGLAVDALIVATLDGGPIDNTATLVGRDRTDLTPGWSDQGTLDDAWGAVIVEERDEGFADGEFGDGGGNIEVRIGTKRLRGSTNGTLVAWSEGAERVLNAVAELTEDKVRNVGWVLGDEVDPHALGADQANDLLDFLLEGVRRVGEEEMGLIKEEDEFRFVEIADFWQRLKEFRQEPEKEGGVDNWRVHQSVGSENVDVPVPLVVCADEVGQPEGWFTKQKRAAGLFEGEEGTLDRADAGGGDVAIGRGNCLAVVAKIVQERAEVVEVEEEESIVVGIFEGDLQNPALGVVEIE